MHKGALKMGTLFATTTLGNILLLSYSCIELVQTSGLALEFLMPL